MPFNIISIYTCMCICNTHIYLYIFKMQKNKKKNEKSMLKTLIMHINYIRFLLLLLTRRK